MTVLAPTRDTQGIEASESWAQANYPGVSIAFTEGVGERPQRRYLVNGEKLPSVTTIMDKHFAKDGLKWWYEDRGIEGMYYMLKETGEIPQSLEACRPALYSYGYTADQQRDKAALTGDQVHAMAEAWHRYRDIPSLTGVDADKRHKVQALAAFLHDTNPDIRGSEILVASLRYRYAGRCDLRLMFPEPVEVWLQPTMDADKVIRAKLPAGTYLADIKSGRAFYQEVGIQLALYEQASRECGWARTTHRMVIHLRDDGRYVVQLFPTRLRTATRFVEAYYGFLEDNKRKTKLNKSLEAA